MKNNASQLKFLFPVWLAALALGFCNGSVRAGDGRMIRTNTTAQQRISCGLACGQLRSAATA